MQMNKMKDVTSIKFDALLRKNINTSYCPRCNALSTEIVIDTSAFGKRCNRVVVRCKVCEYETKSYDAVTPLNDIESSRFGNPMLEKSMVKAIYNAVDEWNGGHK